MSSEESQGGQASQPVVEAEPRPWLRVSELCEQGDVAGLCAFLDALTPGEGARAMAHLPEEERARVLALLPPGEAAWLLAEMPSAQAAEIVEDLGAAEAAAILEELPSDERTDLLNEIEDDEAAAILAEMEPSAAADVEELSRYESDVAGGLMVREYLSFAEHARVEDVLDDLRANAERYSDYDVQYAYVVDAGGSLAGVLRLRDLVLAPPGRELAELMIRDPVSVPAHRELDDLADFFEERAFVGVPIVDRANRLVGVLRRVDVEHALSERSESERLREAGIVGGDELRSMPTWLRARRRFSWLSPNILLNLISASVIGFFTETLEAVIALAVFLPIISDMSGCSGNQAVAVSMRELSLGLVRPADALYVWGKEAVVGLVNGIALGFIVAGVAIIWQGNAWLGLVVGAALALNTLVAVSIGGMVPLLLKRFDLDPALGSGPILTTLTDMCGFFFVLGFASLALPHLT